MATSAFVKFYGLMIFAFIYSTFLQKDIIALFY